MNLALKQAQITLGNTKTNPAVGCVVTKNNNVVSAGHTSINGRPHAEQNALCDCAKRGVSCENSVAYITHYPCIICCRLLIASGIKKIKYINDYKNDKLVKHFCELSNIIIEKI